MRFYPSRFLRGRTMTEMGIFWMAPIISHCRRGEKACSNKFYKFFSSYIFPIKNFFYTPFF